ncbi:MAG TPA: nuclear transport factor 2 family protein [Bradyrhizobium sp.]|nr:nuclear transport factor 2 family protein [Bradyrhizobium sp.]
MTATLAQNTVELNLDERKPMAIKTLMKSSAAIALSGIFLLLQPLNVAAQQPSVEQLHNELRAVKDRAVKAVNSRDEAALLKELLPDVLFTAMNNERVRGIDGIKAYYQKMMVGGARIIKEMSISAEADDLTTLYNGGNTGVVTGTSNADFKLMAGLDFSVPLRWTATLIRADNSWKIAGLHFSADIFDNPLMSASGRLSRWIAIVGIPLAFLLGFWLARRRFKAAAPQT